MAIFYFLYSLPAVVLSVYLSLESNAPIFPSLWLSAQNGERKVNTAASDNNWASTTNRDAMILSSKEAISFERSSAHRKTLTIYPQYSGLHSWQKSYFIISTQTTLAVVTGSALRSAPKVMQRNEGKKVKSRPSEKKIFFFAFRYAKCVMPSQSKSKFVFFRSSKCGESYCHGHGWLPYIPNRCLPMVNIILLISRFRSLENLSQNFNTCEPFYFSLLRPAHPNMHPSVCRSRNVMRWLLSSAYSAKQWCSSSSTFLLLVVVVIDVVVDVFALAPASATSCAA